MIQQNRVELDENVYEPFLKRNGHDEVAFEDFAASIELQKLIHHAHNDFRNEAKKHLAVNPDNHASWRNAIRRCQHCREVWVKVEGCDDATTCGARPTRSDTPNDKSFFRLIWHRIEGKLRPGRFLMERKSALADGSSPQEASLLRQNVRPIGCGKQIVWKDQAIVSMAELDCLFSTKEMENILSSFKMGSEFRRLKRKRDRQIKVFGKLDEKGQDIIDDERESAKTESDGDDGMSPSSSGDVAATSGNRVLLA